MYSTMGGSEFSKNVNCVACDCLGLLMTKFEKSQFRRAKIKIYFCILRYFGSLALS